MSVAKVLSTNSMKNIQIFVVTFALLMLYAVMPAPAHASGLTQVQKDAVVNLLASFGADQSVLNNVNVALNGGVVTGASSTSGYGEKGHNGSGEGNHTGPGDSGNSNNNEGSRNPIPASFGPGASACGLLQRTLTRGSQGDDVAQLQGILKQSGDFANASTTGYFGPATERALQQWQSRQGVVSSGDSSSTGYGAVGPKTREALMKICKEVVGIGNGNDNHGNTGSTTPFGNGATTSPTCVLRANKSAIRVGESVTLIWESRNATSSSSSVTGVRGPANGSIVVAPTETMTYLKRVYGPAGEGQCITTVMVGTDTTPAAEQKVVVVPTTLDVGKVFSLMGSGMAAVMDGYLSLFGLSLE